MDGWHAGTHHPYYDCDAYYTALAFQLEIGGVEPTSEHRPDVPITAFPVWPLTLAGGVLVLCLAILAQWQS